MFFPNLPRYFLGTCLYFRVDQRGVASHIRDRLSQPPSVRWQFLKVPVFVNGEGLSVVRDHWKPSFCLHFVVPDKRVQKGREEC